jgi:hypothetical protein
MFISFNLKKNILVQHHGESPIATHAFDRFSTRVCTQLIDSIAEFSVDPTQFEILSLGKKLIRPSITQLNLVVRNFMYPKASYVFLVYISKGFYLLTEVFYL